MSLDPKHDKYIQDHGHVHSEPVLGHEGTNFEGTDASVGIVLGSLAVIAGTLLVTALLTFPIQNILKHNHPLGNLPSPIAPARVVPPAPYLQVHPWEEYPDLVGGQLTQLHHAGSDPAGRTHIPIDQAIGAVTSKLPVRPNAPTGITIPGGQGRDFSGTQTLAPAPQQQPPTIQGEIQKNAQPEASH